MKILAICQYYYPENFTIYKICEQLVKFGHEVTVVTTKPSYGYEQVLPEYKNVDEEILNGVKVIRLTIKPRKHSRLSIINNYLMFWARSRRYVRKIKEKYDVVFSMSLSPVTILSAGNLYKRKHNVPHVVYCVDLWPESVLVTKAVKEKSFLYKFIKKWSVDLYKQVDSVLIGSPSFEKYFNEVLNIKDKPFTYCPQCSLKEDAPGAYEYENAFNILYCGNIGLLQNVEIIPDVMKQLKDTNIKVHIIGMGPKVDELKKKISDFNLDNVIYHGPIPSKKAVEYFVNVDAIYVSLKDSSYVGRTIPNKIQMAMAFSKPIIGAISGDGKDIIDNANCGVTCNLEISSIVDAFKTMSKLDKSKLKKLGDNSKVYYQNNFEISKSAKVIEKALFDSIK